MLEEPQPLIPIVEKKKRRAPVLSPAETNPIARVALTGLQTALLDREFDFLVPAKMADTALPGRRVRVQFNAQLMDGFIVSRLPESDHPGELAYLKTLVSEELVLSQRTYDLVKAVATYYAGTVSDVLRFAIPPRHARVEAEPFNPIFEPPEIAPPLPEVTAETTPETPPVATPRQWQHLWDQYQKAQNKAGMQNRNPLSYIWTPLPGLAPPIPPAIVPHLPRWAAEIAVAATKVLTAKRDVLIIAPDLSDVTRIIEALTLAGLPAAGFPIVRLVAEDGPANRYRAFLMAARGQARVIVGTRAAVFAPLSNPGLFILWGESEESLIEPQTPYYHAREVLKIRSELQNVPLLIGSIGRTVESQFEVQNGEAIELAASRHAIRARAPIVRNLDSEAVVDENHPGRIPSAAWRVIHDGLAKGPVLVQVPRSGYLPALACAKCRKPAICPYCQGPLRLTANHRWPKCVKCDRQDNNWRCPNCQANKLKGVRIGAHRTAEELGRSFPGTRVIVSSADSDIGVLPAVDVKSGLVIATPGAEPVARGGYAAAVLLDAGLTTAHVGLDSEIQALARWLAAAHLVVPARAGGQVALVGDAAAGPVAALVRLDPSQLAAQHLGERQEIGLPPFARAAEVTGDEAAVAAIVSHIALPNASIFDPIPLINIAGSVDSGLMAKPPLLVAEPRPLVGEASLLVAEPPPLVAEPQTLGANMQVRTIIRVPRNSGIELACELKAALLTRAAKREPGKLKVQLDPTDIA